MNFMDDNEVAGQIIGGNSSKILVRGKFGKRLELGDLLIADEIMVIKFYYKLKILNIVLKYHKREEN